MKRGIVLAGGGTRGAFQAGVIKALQELGVDYNLIVGVSIGALNGALLAQKDEVAMIDLWENRMGQSMVLADRIPSPENIEEFFKDANGLIPFMKNYVKEKGVDITPFKDLLKEMFDEERFKQSELDFGLLMTEVPTKKPRYVLKKDMKSKEDAIQCLLGSSACFPIFPLIDYEGKTYIDGGYSDNLPIDLALEMGATELIVVDLSVSGTHPHFMNKEGIKYIKPSVYLGGMFDFMPINIKNNIQLGYLETMKSYGKYDGFRYTFEKGGKLNSSREFYLNLLRRDHQSKFKRKVLEDQLVIPKLCKETGRSTLTEYEVNLALLEQLMQWMKKEVYQVYQIEEVLLEVLQEFDLDKLKEVEVLPSLSLLGMKSYLQTISRLEVVKKIVSQEVLSQKQKIPQKLLETVFSLEIAVAKWIQNQLMEERK